MSSKKFDRLLEKATDSTLLEVAWENILLCVDAVRSGEIPPKIALSSVRKRYRSENPHVAHHALMVLEALVKNCGEKIHKEIATKEFMEDLKHLVDDSATEKVKEKTLELIQCWSHAFRNKPEYKIVNDTHNLMKLEGFTFAPLRESDAMFDAESAPEWLDSDKCHRCRVEFGFLTRKHHCRNCGQVFCDKCSSRSIPLPHIGIETDVRVCETCFDAIRTKSSSTTKSSSKANENDADPHAPSSDAKLSNGSSDKHEAEIREEEELQLALAISQSEAEEKEREKQRYMLKTYGGYSPKSSSPRPQINNNTQEKETSHESLGYTGTLDRQTENTVENNETENELAKYLNRGYWETRRTEQKRGILRNSPTPSAPVAPPPDLNHVAENDSIANENDATYGNAGSDNNAIDSASDFTEFADKLRSGIEIFVNRIRNDKIRGRSVVTDSGVQAMFVNFTSMHTQLLRYMSELDDRRGFYESLQDKLAQIKDAREAVDALREEHAQRRQAELLELQRQRQVQMAAKLDVMRQKKHEMLEQQRIMAMQRIEEQRREMEFRRQMQIQQQQQPVSAFPMQTSTTLPMVQMGSQSQDVYSMQQMSVALPGVVSSQGMQQPFQYSGVQHQQPQSQGSESHQLYAQQVPYFSYPGGAPPVVTAPASVHPPHQYGVFPQYSVGGQPMPPASIPPHGVGMSTATPPQPPPPQSSMYYQPYAIPPSTFSHPAFFPPEAASSVAVAPMPGGTFPLTHTAYLGPQPAPYVQQPYYAGPSHAAPISATAEAQSPPHQLQHAQTSSIPEGQLITFD